MYIYVAAVSSGIWLKCDSWHAHGSALPAFISWCDNNSLDLNVSKTKELIIDFGKNRTKPVANYIHGKEVEIVDSYKYLGTIFDSQFDQI